LDPYFLAPYGGMRPKAPAWFEDALCQAPERTHFSSGGAQLELLTWGELGKPGLLFVHGNSAHADWWGHIAPFFAADWRCAALSLSGMGRSDRRAEGYTIDVFAQELRDAADAAGLLRASVPPLVVAHSFGGMVSIAAASEDDLFAGLLIIDTPIDMVPGRMEEMRARAIKRRTQHLVFPTIAEGLARFRLSPPQQAKNDFIADHIARCSLVRNREGWSWHFDARGVSGDSAQTSAQARLVRCPMAFVYGARSGLLTPENLMRTVAVLPAGTPVIEIPDAAHHVLIDQPLALVSTLRALLARWHDRSAALHKS
jgi:pimeloyl-ACP methyl ester carboxylesterase